MNAVEQISSGESQTLEFKRSFGDETLETISAFSNAEGGAILIGVDDDGSVPGVIVGKKTLEDFAHRIQSSIDPKIQPSIRVVGLTQDNKNIIEIGVKPSTTSAVSFNGRFFKRVGKTNQRMSGEEIAQHLMSTMKLSWDSGLEPKQHLDDIDQATVERFFSLVRKSNRRPLPDDLDTYAALQKFELIENGQPTRAAMLLFAKAPHKYFESAFVKVGLFKTETRIIDDKEIHGGLIVQVEETIAWLRDRLKAEVIVGSTAAREMDWEYPLDAVREAVANAICHRDYKNDAHIQIRLYENRLEFWNPGGLPPGLDVTDLLTEHQSHPRNKRIAESFFLCGFIERWGTGTLRMAEALKTAGHPAPEFDNSGSHRFRVIFRKEFTEESLVGLGLTDRQVAAVLHLKKEGRLTNQEYQSMFGISKRTASRELTELLEKSIIQRHGKTGKGTFYSLP